jgi:hypothetical protein
MSYDFRLEIEQRDRIIREQAEMIEQQAARIEKQAATIEKLEAKVERLMELLEGKAKTKSAKKPIFTENYSLERNSLERNQTQKDKQAKKEPKKTAGRKPTEEKRDQATKKIDVYAENASHAECTFHRSQFVWRIFEGKAIYVQYNIYDLPASKNLPLPPGVRTSRSEFGIEIILILAFLHYWIGISLDNACEVTNYFTGLELSKSQTESLLKQLANDWGEQYDTIAELMALQMVVYIDETGWRIGQKHCYTWVFSTSMHVLFRCGVSRKKSEATAVLGEDFAGIGVTDDYAAYRTMFTQHQLCWAHLIRKAIKLALQNPNETEYMEFLDQLCLLYHDAKSCQNVETNQTIITQTIKQLQERVTSLCRRRDEKIITPKFAEKQKPVLNPTVDHLATFINLQRELTNNLDKLFVFVEHAEVEPTNNLSERNVRREAEIRKASKCSKSEKGAKRRGVIMTVLASLKTRIPNFTLANVLLEIETWFQRRSSRFQQELLAHQSNRPPPIPDC